MQSLSLMPHLLIYHHCPLFCSLQHKATVFLVYCVKMQSIISNYPQSMIVFFSSRIENGELTEMETGNDYNSLHTGKRLSINITTSDPFNGHIK